MKHPVFSFQSSMSPPHHNTRLLIRPPPFSFVFPEQTLGDDHPVTEESMQALAAAGGSLSSPQSGARPSPISAADPPPGAAVDPPPPSLECLASFKMEQAEERLVWRTARNREATSRAVGDGGKAAIMFDVVDLFSRSFHLPVVSACISYRLSYWGTEKAKSMRTAK